jgi:hypothetical protein
VNKVSIGHLPLFLPKLISCKTYIQLSFLGWILVDETIFWVANFRCSAKNTLEYEYHVAIPCFFFLERNSPKKQKKLKIRQNSQQRPTTCKGT